MNFSMFKWIAMVGLFSFFIASCFTSGKRNPSSDYLNLDSILSDNFNKDGYDHSQKRDFGGGSMSKEQAIQELAGRTIWFKSAPNEKHHTYIFPQKIGVGIDWSQAFLAKERNRRFQTWGLINDPDCCTPGMNCEEKGMSYNGRSPTLEDTYGWDYCLGDEQLLNSLRDGKVAEYKDPACDDPVIKAADNLSGQIRENRCELKFGTSTGAVGFRKYPNPRFNAKRWQKIGGYKNYSEAMIREGANNSIQPPFRVATACASCHAAFDPLNTPKDLNNPTWANIKGETGNQYINVSKLMANGMKETDIETQLFTHTRPGTVDTSAVPHDWLNNPGTINAIINLHQRPLFKDVVSKWVPVNSCNETESSTCQKVPYRDEQKRLITYKYWQWKKGELEVPHILKGGEDSVGYELALQRVYVNIGMCSEQCWQNHLTNLRELDSSSRGFGQSAFNIAQCRAQCSAWRANEDRVGDLISYLISRRPTDLKEALKKEVDSSGGAIIPETSNKSLVDLSFKKYLENQYGVGSLERGQKIFATNCAQCHSSQNKSSKTNLSPNENNFSNLNFMATTTLKTGEIIRADWLGNDKSTSVAEVGTYACRALHTNHSKGHVWDSFSSESYKNLPSAEIDKFENKISGGPGYYRNISLLNVWAHAPFMHNNAIGPEICGTVEDSRQVVRSTIESIQTDSVKKFKCEAYFDPSVKGRLHLYEKSMDELLTSESSRRKKITRIDVPIKFPLGLKDMYIEFPAGMALNEIANFDLKGFIVDFTFSYDLIEQQNNEKEFLNFYKKKFSDDSNKATEVSTAMRSLIKDLVSIKGIINLSKEVKAQNPVALKTLAKYYNTCRTNNNIENGGHNFKTDLSPKDKKDLIAFMATL